MSIWTPLAWPSFGRNSEYGKLDPTMRRVSQPSIMSKLGGLDHLVGRVLGALADEDGHLLAAVQDLGGPLQVSLRRQDAGRGVADGGEDGAVLARRRGHGLLFLNVVRDDDRGNAAAGEGDAQRAVDEVPRLRRLHADLHELGDVL